MTKRWKTRHKKGLKNVRSKINSAKINFLKCGNIGNGRGEGSADAIYSFGSKWELAGGKREKMFIKKKIKEKN